MKKLIITLLAVPFLAQANMKSVMESLHGEKMEVEYHILNTGKHLLLVQEKTGVKDGKPQFKLNQTVELNIQKGEALAMHEGFRCETKDKNTVYAVITKSRAKENGPFAPEKAWTIGEKNIQLIPIAKPADINCVWAPNGDSKFPYK